MVVSKELLDTFKRHLSVMTADWDEDGGGVCHGSVNWIDGDRAGTEITASHKACHAWMTRAYAHACYHPHDPRKAGQYYLQDWGAPFHPAAINFVTLSCHRHGTATQEASDFLIRWLGRESPFSRYVLNRDDDESLLNGMILLCGPDGLRLSEAMWMCKVSRFTTEGNRAANVFMDLVKGGVDGMLAIYVASMIRGEANGGYTFLGIEGHSTVVRPGGTDLIGMMERKVNFKAPNTQSVFAASKIARGVKLDAINNTDGRIRDFCKPIVKDDGWGGKVKSNAVAPDILVKHVLDWEKDLQVLVRREEVPLAMPTNETVYLELDL